MGSIPLERHGSGPWFAAGDLPPSRTTSAKEGANGGLEKRPDAGERPSDEEGPKSSHSGSSSPVVRDGEKGDCVGAEECGRRGGGYVVGAGGGGAGAGAVGGRARARVRHLLK
jgi:hypothetical protein